MKLENNEYFVYAKNVEFKSSSSDDEKILNNIFINTVTLNDLKGNSISSSDNTIIRIYVNPLIPIDEVSFNLTIDSSEMGFEWTKPVVDLGSYNVNYSKSTNMNIPNNSYMLLRVNPKISGNVKVVVDENSNLYLDTFKINSELSKRKYRKVPVSYKDYYGRNLAAFANNLPAYSYLYEVPENYHKIFTVVNDYKDQYVDMYRYGASNNKDKLYEENFSLLAPLSVGKIIPDFFAVFKLNGVLDLTKSLSDIDIMKKFIKEGKLIKSYDLRENSKLGTYLRTIQENAKDSNGSLYVAYNPSQFNTYTGISIDKGVVSTVYESPYALKYKNQVQSDNFYTLGFERNNVLSDHIINFEYMFNDEDADLFEINTYFGLYLRVNENNKMCFCLDGSIYEIDGKTPYGLDFDASEENNKDLIYCFSDQNNCYRIDSSIYGFDKLDNYNNRVGENIFTSSVKKVFDREKDTNISYLTCEFENIIEPEEHFKIIDRLSDSSINVYEIVFSNYEKYKKDSISRTILNTAHSEDNSVDYNFYRISLYSEYRDSIDSVTIENQISNISKAFNKLADDFDLDIHASSYKNRISITSSKENLEFERITNMCEYGLDSSIEDKTIKYFNVNNKVEGQLLVDGSTSLDDVYFANNFEILGNRKVYIVDFKSVEKDYAYQVKVNDLDIYKDYFKFLFISKGKTYIIDNLYDADISFSDLSKVLFELDEDIEFESQTNFYLPYIWNFGIASIFNIKDFNFNVLDAYSDIAMPGEQKKNISDKNNYIDFDLLEDDSTNIVKDIPSEVFSSYISDTDSVPIFSQINVIDVSTKTITIIDSSDATDASYRDISVYIYDHPTELSMNKYLKFKYDRNISSSNISLTSPYNCKWVSTGTDVLFNNIKLTYNNNLLSYDPSTLDNNTKSYFIPVDLDSSSNTDSNKAFSSILGLLYVPSISAESYKKYYKNLFNSNFDSSTSLRDSIYKGNLSIDNLIYSSENYKNKYSKVYYRGNNTLEFISSGVKFNIKFYSTAVEKLERYNNYKAILISTTGRNLYNDVDTEIFIDETSETITLIWHQCVNSLDYKNRESATIYPYSDSSNIYVKRISMNYDVNMLYISDNRSLNIPTYSYIDTFLNSINDASIFMSGINLLDDYNSYDKFIAILNSPNVVEKNSSSNVNMVSGNSNTEYWINKDHSTIKNLGYNNILNNIHKPSKTDLSYILSFNEDSINQYKSVQTYSDLKNIIKDSAIYIKTDKSLKYYDNTYSNLYSVKVIDPIEETFIKTNRTEEISDGNVLIQVPAKHYVHPTYFEPEMIDVFNFEYEDSEVEEKFHQNFNLSNIRINDVNDIDQIWYNKLSSDLSYCFNCNYTAFGLGIDVKNNCSILESVWAEDFFNKYSRDEIQDEYDRKNLEGQQNFIINESIYNNDTVLYNYLPKIPNYLISNQLDLSDVESNIKLNKEIFNKDSYDASILYVYNKECDGENLYSNCVESPNFKRI